LSEIPGKRKPGRRLRRPGKAGLGKAGPGKDGAGSPAAPRPTGAARYILFHKPYGVLCQFTSPDGRPCLKDFVPVPGIYACGRLDWDSEGLLLLTNDGAFIHGVASPEAKLPKTYWVQVEGVPDEKALASLRAGVLIEGRKTLPARADRFPKGEALPPRSVPIRFRKEIPTSWIRLSLVEGRNRQVRRMTAAVGHPTLRLIRHAIGSFTLEGLAPGEWREIPRAEVRGIV
jgi:23S rRNA pseudouridine2457 synthase